MAGALSGVEFVRMRELDAMQWSGLAAVGQDSEGDDIHTALRRGRGFNDIAPVQRVGMRSAIESISSDDTSPVFGFEIHVRSEEGRFEALRCMPVD